MRWKRRSLSLASAGRPGEALSGSFSMSLAMLSCSWSRLLESSSRAANLSSSVSGLSLSMTSGCQIWPTLGHFHSLAAAQTSNPFEPGPRVAVLERLRES